MDRDPSAAGPRGDRRSDLSLGAGASADPHLGPRGRLFFKYVVLFVVLVSASLAASGIMEMAFAYREQMDAIERIQTVQANAAAERIGEFVGEIQRQLGWTTVLPWTPEALEQRRFDALRLLRQVPAITEVSEVDADGRERLRVSRLAGDVIDSDLDLSNDPRFVQAVATGTYYGPVYYLRDSEPFMSVAQAGNRRVAGVTIAEVNLKLIWDLITDIKVGVTGIAYVVDKDGRLIAHPDISLVLRNTDFSALPQVGAAIGADVDADATARNPAGAQVIATAAAVPDLGWFVLAELPLREAAAPLMAAIFRTGGLLLLGLVVAVVVGLVLARRMIVPIKALADGAERIGAGQLDHPIEVHTGDELEALAGSFNTMAGRLGELERMRRLKRFLSPAVAEAVLAAPSKEGVLDSHRAEITVLFADLRGFTSFAEAVEPEDIMSLLREYHALVGERVDLHKGTLERFAGDGVMIFFNDPVPCDDHCQAALRLGIELVTEVGALLDRWNRRGAALGVGIGIATGYATLGTVGYAQRLDYAAIGTVTNLASRLCQAAAPGQVLVSARVAEVLGDGPTLTFAGDLTLKGFRKPVPAYAARKSAGADPAPAATGDSG